jgi:sodium/bile acid cotransporter 7
VTWLLLPLAAGQLLRPVLGGFVSRYKARLGILDRVTILCLVYTSFCDSFKAGVWNQGILPVAVAFGVAVALLASVMLIMTFVSNALGFSRPDRITALFCGSKKSLAAGVPMARLMFGSHPALAIILLPIIVYHSLQLVVGGFLAARFARSQDNLQH